MMYLFSQSEIRPSINDNIKLVKSLAKDKFHVTINGEKVADVLGFESDATDCYTLDEVLYEMLPDEVTAQIVTEDKFDRHIELLMLSIEIDDHKLCNFIENKKARDKKEKARRNMDGLLEIRRLLDEENIVTGKGEDCSHQSFKHEMSFYPCPWDSRVLNGSNSPVDCGCYYKCAKNDEKILANKEIYIKSIDTLVDFLKDDPEWGFKYKEKKATINSIDKAKLDRWTKQKEHEDKIVFEQKEKHKKENEVHLRGCPLEFITDLKKLHKLGALQELKDDYEFLEDKIIYTFVDYYDFSESTIDIDTNNIYFTMCPNQDNSKMEIRLGAGMVQVIDIDLTDKNKESLLSFWSKWKKFRKDNPELYKNRIYSNSYK